MGKLVGNQGRLQTLADLTVDTLQMSLKLPKTDWDATSLSSTSITQRDTLKGRMRGNMILDCDRQSIRESWNVIPGK